MPTIERYPIKKQSLAGNLELFIHVINRSMSACLDRNIHRESKKTKNKTTLAHNFPKC